ncbi:MAG TPA: hypothetical protein VHA10_11880 [Hypericibacter adhaerens]|uniref:hypothetical protein n=1 Tax=Hypericibacter adhaerens TaxID=2602016 RepID=UPI002C6AC748|nr:hypothetical protein [Hypericibacter adhaerens]HWA43903.1 hypothetical protein [Hypericibacter adhaerens]
MPALETLDGALPADLLGARIFAGDILIFRQLPALRSLCRTIDEMVRAGLGDEDPERAETRLAPDLFLARVRALRSQVRADKALLRQIGEAVAQTGLPPEDTYFDGLQLRLVPSNASHQARRIMPLAPHRDSWGSNIPQQINWWAPLYPLARTRSIVMFPDYWSRPIENNSAAWDYHELKRRMAEGRAEGYPVLPVATVPLKPEDGLAIVIEPGDLLCFSAAHLHGSIADASGITRFSLETRSVSASHVRAGMGAPNLDGQAPRVTPEWFERIEDGASLSSIF